MRRARYPGASAEVWMGLQSDYDLRLALRAKQRKIERTVRLRSETAA